MTKLLAFLALVYLFSFLGRVNGEFEKNVYFQTIVNNENAFKWFNPGFDKYMSLLDLILNDNNQSVGLDCQKSLRSIKQGLAGKEEWALKYFESNGAPKKGFLNGYYHDLGKSQLCLSIEPSSLNQTVDNFRSQFCLVSVQTAYFENVKKEQSYQDAVRRLHAKAKFIVDFSYGSVLGFCVPQTCDVKQLLLPINRALSSYEMKAIVQTKCAETTFYDSSLVTPGFFLSLLILGIPSSLAIGSLFLGHKFLRPFSLKENFNWVYRNGHGGSREPFLQGYKAIYVVNSVPIHFFGLFYGVSFLSFYSAGLRSFEMHWLTKSFLAREFMGIDLMFFLSGFLVFTTVFEKVKNNKVNLLKSVLFWIIKIWPTYIGFLAVMMVGTVFCTGNLMRDIIVLWHENFWTNVPKVFTFMSHLDHIPEQVVVFSWFNSINFQLFVIFYFVMLIFARSHSAGLIVSFVLLVSNILLQGRLMIEQKILPCYDIFKTDIVSFNDLEKDYFNVWNHFDIYLVGFVTGWVYQHKKVSFLRRGVFFYPLFFITLALSLSPLYTPLLFEMAIVPKHQLLLAAYFSTKRLLISCFPAFCLLSFKENRMKLFNTLMSSKYLLPFGRLASSIITCQFFCFFLYFAGQTDQIRFTAESLTKDGLFGLLVTFIFANLFFFLFEAPVGNLMRQLFAGERTKPNEPEKIKPNSEMNEKNLKQFSVIQLT